jgi:hypothetical protein
MAQNFPTFSQLKATFLAEFESKINQSSPLNNKAFLRICATIMAIIAMLIQREVVINTKENLAITASRTGLIAIGEEYDLPIKDEESTVLTATLPAATGTNIPALTNFTGDDNGILYYDSSSVISIAGVATMTLISRTPGTIGNLQVGQTLSIAVQIAGAEQTATITSIDTLGADAEDTEVYRQRILDIERAPGGGGNSADYRNWAQETDNVARAFPYSGLPWDDGGWPGEPPERTVYIESTTSYDPDGIPDAALLTAARDMITTDPVSLEHRQPLGLTDDTLYVEPIRRTVFYVEITNLTWITGTEAQVKAALEAAVIAYFLGLQPFIAGLDIDADRNDLITDLTITRVVQDVLTAQGASAEGVDFGTSPSPAFLANYTLGQGEKAKLVGTGITYA